MRNGNLLKSQVSEICVKRICVNQGVGVSSICMSVGLMFFQIKSEYIIHWMDIKNPLFGRFLKKLCLYFAREGMVIDLVFWSSFSAAVWITTPMEKHLLKLIPTIYDMHYVCWNWILQIPIQFNWMVMDMVVSRKFSSFLDYLVKYILHTSHIGK